MDPSLPSPDRNADRALGLWGALKAAAGLMGDKGPAGRLLRVVVPVAILVIGLSGPAIFALHRLGYVGVAEGTALFGAINAIVVIAVVLRSAWLLQGEDITLRRLQDEIQRESLHDSLTGLANRGFFMDQLARRAALADRRTSAPFAVCSLELDGLDRVSQAAGPETRNRILVKAAEMIRDCVRASDMVARLDGDKFGILLEEIADAKDINILAERIVSSVPPALEDLSADAPIAVSIGVILKTSGHDRPGEMLREADAALQVAKRRGPGRFELTAFAD